MGTIIAYLSWKDFLEEVRAAQPHVVRVQAYSLTVPKSDPRLVRFWIDVGFLSRLGNDIHIARFPLGSDLEFHLQNDPSRRQHFASLMQQAEDILRKALFGGHVVVRRGVFVEADRVSIQTDPDGLWRWEQDGDLPRLIPEPQEEAAR